MFNKYHKVKKEYYKKIDNEYRKHYGQFFTPEYIAELMVQWVVQNKKDKSNIRFLDPALGLGIFLKKLYDVLQENFTFYGYEIDNKLLKKMRSIVKKIYLKENKKNIQLKLLNNDYLTDWGQEFDAIVCNPPYIIYKQYDNEVVQKKFIKNQGVDLSGFCNIYIYFLIKSLTELKYRGRMAYILPLEFFNADYGKKVKKVIKDYGYLRHVLILKYNVFSTITTSAILLFENDNNNGKQNVNFFTLQDNSELNNIFFDLSQNVSDKNTMQEDVKIPNSRLEPDLKWRVYYHFSNDRNSNKYRYLVKFSKYARVVRGIATGANDFFLFNKTKKNMYNIKEEFLIPCLSKASFVNDYYFDSNKLTKLIEQDKQVFILNVNSADVKSDEDLKKYIDLGIKKGYHQRYLTKHRSPWYVIEKRKPAPVLVKTFNRKGLNFVLNEVGISNLTSFHCIYIKNKDYSILLKAYLLTEFANELFAENKREYGNGLIKYEPNDLNKSYIPDLAQIDDDTVDYINQVYETFLEKLINNDKPDLEIKELNSIFINKFKI